MSDFGFWKNKRIFVTGHTGFKGTWLSKILTLCGAEVTGYSLGFPTADGEAVFRRAGLRVNSVFGDIRDYSSLNTAFEKSRPEIVIHLAAQPIVEKGYSDPVETYSTNVMGTVNLLECARKSKGVKSVLVITTDKVYENKEWAWGYRETDALGGADPYANSESCSELVTCGYKKSFFDKTVTAVSTARAGNVIGGGDFSPGRIVPDCIRAALAGRTIEVRHPDSVRPYQHVLEPLSAYLMICRMQYEDKRYEGEYNVGPDNGDAVTTGTLAEKFCGFWGGGQQWEARETNGFAESRFLRLDSSKIKSVLGWRPVWNIDTALEKTVEWAKAYKDDEDISAVAERQIKEFTEARA